MSSSPYTLYKATSGPCFHLQDLLLEKFAQKGPTCIAFDEKMYFYSCVAEDIATQSNDKEVQFAVLHMSPLARALQENARSWVTSLGKLLNDAAKESLENLDKELTVRHQPGSL